MDFHAVVAKRRRECCAAALLVPFMLLARRRRYRRRCFMRSWRAPTAASCRSTARTRSKSAESTSMSAAPMPRRARYAGWRIAQRQGFKALWAKMHNAPIAQAPNLAGRRRSTRSSARSTSSASRSAPTATSRISACCSTAAAPRQFLGVEGGEVEHSAPMLLIPVMVSGGTATSVELRNAWQRAWAQFRTVAEPDRLCPGQRHGRRSAADQRGADARARAAAGGATCSTCTARPTSWSPKSSCSGSIPGGPARARFIARHGPDDEIIGGFTLTAPNSDGIPAMMAEGAQRMDQLFAQALAAGRLTRDSSLDLPPPPALPRAAGQQKPAAAGERRQLVSRSRSPARTSISTISRWRTCTRCRASSRRLRSRSIRAGRATSW